MNDSCKIINITEIEKRKKQILDVMIKEVQEYNEQKLLKKRAAIEMKYLKPELLKINQKKNNHTEQLIKSQLICKEFEDFILQTDNNDDNKND